MCYECVAYTYLRCHMYGFSLDVIFQASVSIKRMNRYMNSDEIDPNNVSHDNESKYYL